MPPEDMMQGLAAAFSHIDPEKVTNGQIYSLLYSMRAQQIQHNMQVAELREKIEKQEKNLADLKTAWDTGHNVIKFVKFLGTVGLPVAGVGAILKFIGAKLGLWH